MKGLRWLSAVVALFLLASPALFAGEPADGNGKIKGQVIEVRQSVATQNQGSATEIKVRTRQQQELWLHLGPSDGKGNGFQVGDTIRARLCKRVSDGDQSAALTVRDIKNYRTGEKLEIRDNDGVLQRDRDRDRDANGDRIQNQDRTRDRDQLRDQSGAGSQHRRGGQNNGGTRGSGNRGGR